MLYWVSVEKELKHWCGERLWKDLVKRKIKIFLNLKSVLNNNNDKKEKVKFRKLVMQSILVKIIFHLPLPKGHTEQSSIFLEKNRMT